ncbi:hypothetical protein ACTTAI_08085 [Rhodobacter capsulatus]|uniref:hypothetical protein n=1 Tax=Rhodobacter capsulatus TaxID=1061 RepID=UPI0040275B6F
MRLDLFQKHHPHIGQPLGIDGGQGNGIGVVDLGFLGFGQPGLRQRKGIFARKDAGSVAHILPFLLRMRRQGAAAPTSTRLADFAIFA